MRNREGAFNTDSRLTRIHISCKVKIRRILPGNFAHILSALLRTIGRRGGFVRSRVDQRVKNFEGIKDSRDAGSFALPRGCSVDVHVKTRLFSTAANRTRSRFSVFALDHVPSRVSSTNVSLSGWIRADLPSDVAPATRAVASGAPISVPRFQISTNPGEKRAGWQSRYRVSSKESRFLLSKTSISRYRERHTQYRSFIVSQRDPSEVDSPTGSRSSVSSRLSAGSVAP